MKRLVLFVVLIACVLGSALPVQAELVQSPYLDAAFSLIEKDNIFLRRYEEITGAKVDVKFAQGVPYFFGGKEDKILFSKYPAYAKKSIFEQTRFYQKGKTYIYGLDCSGYTQWVYSRVGKPAHDSLSNMILKKAYAKNGNHIFNHSRELAMPPYDQLKDHLQVGDLLVGKHRARHIMMYIGTLRDYGFTKEEVPELAEFLDYPLVIHSGPNPFYGERFEEVIRQDGGFLKNCLTTNGGVCVSIVGVPVDRAPHHVEKQRNQHDYFLIDGGRYMLTIYDLPSATSFCWFRM